jgi:acetyl/propionyl-CoA carboxylase alpha subunit
MNPKVRAAMGDVAVRAAKAVGYRSAGTVEFLFEETDDGPQFFFLEMNTRLQVEHPVTEWVVGRDLVWDQLRVAAGEPLGYEQSDVVMRGHAVECRVYAEDPVTFLPRPGRVDRLRWPEGGGVRIDGAVGEGSEVSSYYDPMIAKVTAWADTRAAALLKMRRVLADTVLLGVQTNIPLHQRVLADPTFAKGTAVTTRFLTEHPEAVPTGDEEIAEEVVAAIAAAAAVDSMTAGSTRSQAVARTPESAWRRGATWRSR